MSPAGGQSRPARVIPGRTRGRTRRGLWLGVGLIAVVVAALAVFVVVLTTGGQDSAPRSEPCPSRGHDAKVPKPDVYNAGSPAYRGRGPHPAVVLHEGYRTRPANGPSVYNEQDASLAAAQQPPPQPYNPADPSAVKQAKAHTQLVVCEYVRSVDRTKAQRVSCDYEGGNSYSGLAAPGTWDYYVYEARTARLVDHFVLRSGPRKDHCLDKILVPEKLKKPIHDADNDVTLDSPDPAALQKAMAKYVSASVP